MNYEMIRGRFQASNLPESMKLVADEYLDALEDVGLSATPPLPLDIVEDYLEYARRYSNERPAPKEIYEAEKQKEEIATFFWHPFSQERIEMAWDDSDDNFHMERFAHAVRNDARFRHIFIGALDMALVNLEEDVMQNDTSSEEYKIMREISGNFSAWADIAVNAMEQAEKE